MENYADFIPIIAGGLVAAIITQLFVWRRDLWAREEGRRDRQRMAVVNLIEEVHRIQRELLELSSKIEDSGLSKRDINSSEELLELILAWSRSLLTAHPRILEARLTAVDPKIREQVVKVQRAWEGITEDFQNFLVSAHTQRGVITFDEVMEQLTNSTKLLARRTRFLTVLAEDRLSPQRSIWQKIKRAKWKWDNRDELKSRRKEDLEIEQTKTGGKSDMLSTRYFPSISHKLVTNT